ncbi:Uncharacterised protein [Vibrio cholerae]|nr:Uncharacterised protein [Vibrio cholerae]
MYFIDACRLNDQISPMLRMIIQHKNKRLTAHHWQIVPATGIDGKRDQTIGSIKLRSPCPKGFRIRF